MQRIVKRFLLHKQRESDEIGEMDFDELKQDLQMIRFELLNDLRQSSEQTTRLVAQLQAGLALIGEEVLRNSANGNDALNKFRDYNNSNNNLNAASTTFNDEHDETSKAAVNEDEIVPATSTK
jgi:hypothetical protein